MQTLLPVSPSEIHIQNREGQPVIDSRVLASMCGVQHETTLRLIREHHQDFEGFGVLRFEIGKPSSPNGGRPDKIALLTEDQATFLITLSRNTEAVVKFKAALVKAFRKARENSVLSLPGRDPLVLLDELIARGVSPDIAAPLVFGSPTLKGRTALYPDDPPAVLHALMNGPLRYTDLFRISAIPDVTRFKNALNKLRRENSIHANGQGKWQLS